MRTSAQQSGDDAEARAAASLDALGWTILGRHVRAGRGELDIVAIDPGPPRHLVIVEVRWRGRRDYGLAEETLDHRKRAHLRSAIGRLLEDGSVAGRRLPAMPFRVDLIVVEPPASGETSPRMRHHRSISL